MAWADVKHIRVGTSASRALDVTTKANKQIKQAHPSAVGAVLIHVDREGHRASFDDRVPSDVKPFIDEVSRALHPGQLRSIGHAVITWDDYFILSEVDRPTMYVARRRALVIAHPQPRGAPLVTEDFWNLGFTGVVTVHPRAFAATPTRLPALEGGDWKVTELFRRVNEFGDGVRPQHACAVLAEPDDRAECRFDSGFSVILACKRIEVGARRHILLVIATQRTGLPVEIDLAFKLYPPPEELAALAASASAAFGYLVEHFALPVEVGQQQGLFVPYEHVPPSGGNTNLVRVPTARDALVCCFYKRVASPKSGTEARWVFAIDRAKGPG